MENNREGKTEINHPLPNGTEIVAYQRMFTIVNSNLTLKLYYTKDKQGNDATIQFSEVDFYMGEIEIPNPKTEYTVGIDSEGTFREKIQTIAHPLPIGTEVFSKIVDGHIHSSTLVKDGMYLYKVKHKYSERVFDVPSGYVFLSEDELKKSLKTDMVNHPQHYGGKDNPMEVIKIIDHYQLPFSLGNTLKYILRADKKANKLEDLKKAAWYLQHEITKLENV